MTQQRLGEILRSQGTLNEEMLRIALQEQQSSAAPLGTLLLRLGFVGEQQLILALSVQTGLPIIPLSDITPQSECLSCLPEKLLRETQCLPISLAETRDGTALRIALADPHDLIKLDRIRHHLPPHWQLEPCLATAGELALAIDRLCGTNRRLEETLQRLGNAPNPEAQGHALVQLVDELLAEAVEEGASDIHFEPEAYSLRIRLRIDGLLHTRHTVRLSVWSAILVRLKILGGLDISETRQAQDGRMTFTLPGRTLDIRLSSLPTLHGENLVLRLLDRAKGIRSLDELGLDTERRHLLEAVLLKPEGLLLVIGPTGSGKTTTLYALLQYLQDDSRHIMTLEDPVEYALPGIRQTAVDPPRLSFANGIRAMLRQDPDILLIGEIRDEETGKMVLRAAQTGHRVFSTLHASTPFTALPRLQQLGLSLSALRGSLNGIVSQRLVRKLCPHCALSAPATQAEQTLLGLEEAVTLYSPVGCPACGGLGYLGRLPLLEILPFTPALDNLLHDNALLDAQSIKQAAHESGWKSLAAHGIQRLRAGETSLPELSRIVDPATLRDA